MKDSSCLILIVGNEYSFAIILLFWKIIKNSSVWHLIHQVAVTLKTNLNTLLSDNCFSEDDLKIPTLCLLPRVDVVEVESSSSIDISVVSRNLKYYQGSINLQRKTFNSRCFKWFHWWLDGLNFASSDLKMSSEEVWETNWNNKRIKLTSESDKRSGGTTWRQETTEVQDRFQWRLGLSRKEDETWLSCCQKWVFILFQSFTLLLPQ